MEPPERRNDALTKFGRPVSELALTTKGKRKRKRSGGSPGKERKGVKERGSGDSREFGSNKRKESGASRGQKGTNQRYNRRFFGVLPEPRSTGETTRTKTDGSLSSEISDSGNERNNKGESGVTPDGKQTNKGKEKERRKLLRSPTRVVCRHTRRKRRD